MESMLNAIECAWVAMVVRRDAAAPELSVVLPCLNEALTLGRSWCCMVLS